MKKLYFSAALLLCLVILAGCSKNKEIDTKNIQKDTFLIKKDSSIEAGTVESFDKGYYDVKELDKYITNKLNRYNTAAGAETVTKKSLELKNSKAVLVLTYKALADFNGFNKTDIKLLTTAAAMSGDTEIPQSFTAVKKHKTVTADKALENSKYNVLIVKENLDVLLQGTIKYYSGGTLVNKHNIQTADTGSTFIVYKP
ncbi:hypothetical protein [Anaerocolumna jejuensis]|uniref:hypothetical protein n=1 Tax=Anaerocolumna jejuensis TaxID=259063 RepID=UPI003F7C72A2